VLIGLTDVKVIGLGDGLGASERAGLAPGVKPDKQHTVGFRFNELLERSDGCLQLANSEPALVERLLATQGVALYAP
jgi:hypothetical protein